MERSLSALLPVRNAESTLVASALSILDVMPELGGDFELLIIDDGSQDATIEVADELASEYPQIQVVRHWPTVGRTSALAAAVDRCRGDFVLVRDENCGVPLSQLALLWKYVDYYDFVLARTEDATRGGLHLFARRAAGPLRHALSHQAALARELERRGIRWHQAIVAANRRAPGNLALPQHRRAGQIPASGRPLAPLAAPNYLGSAARRAGIPACP